MVRLRLCASLLSILSLAIAMWALTKEDTGRIVVALLFASACLAIVAPFDAPAPRRRTRVLLACLVYVAAVAAALALGYVGEVPGSLMAALVLLAQLGTGLALWAFATRSRRRLSTSRRYYDN